MAGPSPFSDGPERPMGLKIRDITSPVLPMIPQEIVLDEEIKTQKTSTPNLSKIEKETEKNQLAKKTDIESNGKEEKITQSGIDKKKGHKFTR
jgi:hypothetical protein